MKGSWPQYPPTIAATRYVDMTDAIPIFATVSNGIDKAR